MEITDAGTWNDVNGDEIHIGDKLREVHIGYDGKQHDGGSRRDVEFVFDKKYGRLMFKPLGDNHNAPFYKDIRYCLKSYRILKNNK